METNEAMVEGLAVNILGEPEKYSVKIEFDIWIYDVALETQTVILFVILYIYVHTEFDFCKTSTG